MSHSRYETIMAIQPRLMRCEGGEWMAVSQSGSPLNIGVSGPTPEKARARFTEALEEWAKLLESESLV